MGRSKGDRELAAQRRATAWELYCQSVPQNQIAAQLGISESATSKLIRQAAAVAAEALPQSREELAAELAERWASDSTVVKSSSEKAARSSTWRWLQLLKGCGGSQIQGRPNRQTPRAQIFSRQCPYSGKAFQLIQSELKVLTPSK
jgi:hypothetical protein